MNRLVRGLAVVCALAGLVIILIFPKAEAKIDRRNTSVSLTRHEIERRERFNQQFQIAKYVVAISKENFEILFTTAEETKVHWQILVALYRVSSNCGRNIGTFNPCEILDWSEEQSTALEKICNQLGYDPEKQVCSLSGFIGPFQIKTTTWEQLGPKGKQDPWKLKDAALVVAKFLKAHGCEENPRQALLDYFSCWDWLGQKVVEINADNVMDAAKHLGFFPKKIDQIHPLVRTSAGGIFLLT